MLPVAPSQSDGACAAGALDLDASTGSVSACLMPSERLPNVVLVTGSLEGGGAERALSEMANYWAERGWRVTFATWTGPEVEDFYTLASGVERAWLDVSPRGASLMGRLTANVGRVFKLRRLLRESRADAVLSFIDVSNVLTILAALGLRLRVVVSERGCPDQPPSMSLYPISRYWRLLRKILYRRADAVTSVNASAAKWLERECRVKATMIPPALRPLPEATQVREPFILAVGRLHPVKGFDLLIRAFARITPDFPSWRLTLIGSGPEKAALVESCEVLKLQSRMEFRDPMHEVEAWMARAGLVVLPSRSEAFGNAVLESMGMGAPVIATECAGPRALIDNGVNGRLVPVGDVDRLAAAMAELLARPHVRESLGREALAVRQRFRQDVVMAQWEACLFPASESAPDAREEVPNERRC